MNSIALILENDNDIINEYVSGNSEMAATAFVRKYQKFVYATALRILGSYNDAEDASQEAFIKALGNLHNFRGDSSLKTWLYRITTNVCLNIKRKNKLLFFLHGDKDEEEIFEIASGEISPEQALDNSEFEKNFLALLSKLPQKQRETFYLRYFEEMPYEEISQMLGTSVGGLKANYFQAVKKIALLLKKEKN